MSPIAFRWVYFLCSNKRYWCGCFTHSFHARLFKDQCWCSSNCNMWCRYSEILHVDQCDCWNITFERYKELIFVHALSGSDYTSSFFHIAKVKFWISWLVNQVLPESFICLGDCPNLPLRDEGINVIEKFIISLYYDDFNCFSIDLAGYEIFKYWQNMDLQSLPLTRDV